MPAETSEDTQLVESEDTKSIESDSDTADFDVSAPLLLCLQGITNLICLDRLQRKKS